MAYNSTAGDVSVTNYLNRDFTQLRSALIEYAKTYYPETYKDFNETSPGMMLIELSSYVGDVLNFYIDKQYRELILTMAQEKKNVVHVAKMLGYKTSPVKPAIVRLQLTQEVAADTTDPNNIVPNISALTTTVVPAGTQVRSTTDDTIVFETLQEVDFSSTDFTTIPPIQYTFDSTSGLTSTFLLTRHVKAISGETKTFVQSVGSPTKFFNLTLPETNVVEVTNLTDTGKNKYHEVDYLVQDRVPVSTHYTEDDTRATSYTALDGESTIDVSVPYTLKYISTPKRYVRDYDPDTNQTVLTFGNGLLRSGTSGSLRASFLEVEQNGFITPGATDTLNQSVDPLASDSFGTLGEAPGNTTLTVQYRVGGGIKSNVPSGDLTTIDVAGISVTNPEPARGGADAESVEEIRRRGLAFFASQARCVTKDDYFARIMNMPAKFGSVAKAYVDRTIIRANIEEPGTVRIFLLSYDDDKHLVRTPDITKQNLRNYLSEFKMITDDIIIQDGFHINFGILFDVTGYPFADKTELKIKVINVIKDFFHIDKMNFKQPIILTELEYLILGIKGVRGVNNLNLTQTSVPGGSSPIFEPGLFNYNASGVITNNNAGYGYPYDFMGEALTPFKTILPSVDPSVFELRDPNNNIKGVVR